MRAAARRVVRTSCSIGLTCLPFVPGKPDAVSWEHAIKIADLALYRAKRGRNAWRGWFGTESVATLQFGHRRGRIQRRRPDRQRRHHRTFIRRAAATTPSMRCACCAKRARKLRSMDTRPSRTPSPSHCPTSRSSCAATASSSPASAAMPCAASIRPRKKFPAARSPTCGPSRSPRTCCRPCAAS